MQRAESDEKFPVLDGLRTLMTFWVVAFHTLWYTGAYSTEKQFLAVSKQPYFLVLTNGLVAVDVFFLMTGFLLSYPILTGVRTGSWASFVWRRVTRLYPSYIFTLLFVCAGIYRFGKLPVIPWDQHVTTGIRELIRSAGQDTQGGIPNNCEMSIFNLLFLNNYIPFGGCMGWTWSLCVQVHFICIFPLVIRWFGITKKLMYALIVGYLCNIVLRYFLYLHVMLPYTPSKMYLFDFEDTMMYFMHFNVWYAPTHMRIGGVFMGVALAYVQYHYSIRQWAQKNKVLATIITTTITVVSFPAVYYTLDTQEFSPLHMSVFAVGAPIWQLTLAFHVYCLLNEVGLLHTFVAKILSLRFLAWLAIPSYPVYLVHQVIIPRVWSNFFAPLWPGFNNWKLLQATLLVLLCSWTFGFVCHYLVEEPIKNLLRKKSFGAKSAPNDGATQKAKAE